MPSFVCTCGAPEVESAVRATLPCLEWQSHTEPYSVSPKMCSQIAGTSSRRSSSGTDASRRRRADGHLECRKILVNTLRNTNTRSQRVQGESEERLGSGATCYSTWPIRRSRVAFVTWAGIRPGKRLCLQPALSEIFQWVRIHTFGFTVIPLLRQAWNKLRFGEPGALRQNPGCDAVTSPR